MVECRDSLREKRGVTVGVTGDQRRKPDRLRVLRQCRQHRVALEHRLVRSADPGELIEVVHHKDTIEPGSFGCLGLRNDVPEDVGTLDSWVCEVRDLIAESSHRVTPAFSWADGP